MLKDAIVRHKTIIFELISLAEMLATPWLEVGIRAIPGRAAVAARRLGVVPAIVRLAAEVPRLV